MMAGVSERRRVEQARTTAIIESVRATAKGKTLNVIVQELLKARDEQCLITWPVQYAEGVATAIYGNTLGIRGTAYRRMRRLPLYDGPC